MHNWAGRDAWREQRVEFRQGLEASCHVGEFVKLPADMYGNDVEIVLAHRLSEAMEQIHHQRTAA